MKTSPSFRRCVVQWLTTATATFAGSISFAQSTPSNRDAASEDVVQLSEFVVTSDDDVGYAASSSLAGSRLKTELKDIAAPISVFTKEFLDDIGATSVNAALEYGLNSVTEYDATGNGIIENNFQTRIRGIAGAGRSRNYMSTNLNIDTYNTERLDFSRGPNSVLFGAGSPAGIINSSTKFAHLDRDFRTLQVRYGSYNEKRVSLDINQSLGENLAFRANLLWQNKDGYRDFEFQDKEGAAGAVTWQPFEKTTVRIEGEYMDIVENRARPWTPFEAYVAWENAGSPGANTATTWGGNVAGATTPSTSGILFMSDGLWADQFVPSTSAQNYKVSNSASATVSGLNTPPNVLDYSLVRRDANYFGAGARSSSESKAGGVFIEQKINEDLSFELAASIEYEERPVVSPMNFGSYRLRYDVNEYLPVFDGNGVQTGMQANPNFGDAVLVTGGGFGNASHVFSSNYRNQLRATGAYHLDFRKLMDNRSTLSRILGHHRMAVLVSDDSAERTSSRDRYVNIHPTRLNTNYFNGANQILWGNHFDPLGSEASNRGLADPFERLATAGVTPMANRPGVFVQPSLERSLWAWTRTDTLSKMFAMQNYFWDDRVVGLFGWRTDDQEFYDSTSVVEPGTTAVRGFLRNDALREISGNTFTRGIVVHVVPDLFSVYYNRANNFQDNGVAEVIGEVGNLTDIGNRAGEGEDYGVKLFLFGGKVSASLGHYETSDANQSISVDGNFSNWTEGIWEAMGTTKDIGGRDSRNLTSEGYEFELTANPMKQITLTFNAKDSETVVDNTYPWARLYLAENRGTWLANGSALVTATGLPVGTTVADTVDRLDSLMTNLTAVEGRAPYADRQRTANFYGRYRFDDSGLAKGFALGFGLQHRGPSLIAYRTITDGGAVYSPSYTMGSAMVSYSRKLSDSKRLKLQLNIDNLFDLQTPQPVAGGEPTAAQLPVFEQLGQVLDGVVYTVQLPEPRRYSLTATLSF